MSIKAVVAWLMLWMTTWGVPAWVINKITSQRSTDIVKAMTQPVTPDSLLLTLDKLPLIQRGIGQAFLRWLNHQRKNYTPDKPLRPLLRSWLLTFAARPHAMADDSWSTSNGHIWFDERVQFINNNSWSYEGMTIEENVIHMFIMKWTMPTWKNTEEEKAMYTAIAKKAFDIRYKSPSHKDTMMARAARSVWVYFYLRASKDSQLFFVTAVLITSTKKLP